MNKPFVAGAVAPPRGRQQREAQTPHCTILLRGAIRHCKHDASDPTEHVNGLEDSTGFEYAGVGLRRRSTLPGAGQHKKTGKRWSVFDRLAQVARDAISYIHAFDSTSIRHGLLPGAAALRAAAEYITYIGTSGPNSKGIYAFRFNSKSGS